MKTPQEIANEILPNDVTNILCSDGYEIGPDALRAVIAQAIEAERARPNETISELHYNDVNTLNEVIDDLMKQRDQLQSKLSKLETLAESQTKQYDELLEEHSEQYEALCETQEVVRELKSQLAKSDSNVNKYRTGFDGLNDAVKIFRAKLTESEEKLRLSTIHAFTQEAEVNDLNAKLAESELERVRLERVLYELSEPCTRREVIRIVTNALSNSAKADNQVRDELLAAEKVISAAEDLRTHWLISQQFNTSFNARLEYLDKAVEEYDAVKERSGR